MTHFAHFESIGQVKSALIVIQVNDPISQSTRPSFSIREIIIWHTSLKWGIIRIIWLYVWCLKLSVVKTKMFLKTNYERTFIIDYREQESRARSMYPTQGYIAHVKSRSETRRRSKHQNDREWGIRNLEEGNVSSREKSQARPF